MPKPQPKKEIHVDGSMLDPRYLVISVYTADAKNWLEENAPEYGILTPARTIPNRYDLWVTPGVWDPKEVAAWIESMGESN